MAPKKRKNDESTATTAAAPNPSSDGKSNNNSKDNQTKDPEEDEQTANESAAKAVIDGWNSISDAHKAKMISDFETQLNSFTPATTFEILVADVVIGLAPFVKRNVISSIIRISNESSVPKAARFFTMKHLEDRFQFKLSESIANRVIKNVKGPADDESGAGDG